MSDIKIGEMKSIPHCKIIIFSWFSSANPSNDHNHFMIFQILTYSSFTCHSAIRRHAVWDNVSDINYYSLLFTPLSFPPHNFTGLSLSVLECKRIGMFSNEIYNYQNSSKTVQKLSSWNVQSVRQTAPINMAICVLLLWSIFRRAS